jgi:energy-coupling factor transporter ATP-binding protein EcfA2
MGILSKGQRKRALLGIGLLTPQPALLIDEPFEGLDLRQARDIAVALRAHAARGGTLFLSIHQIGAAARFCDRFLLLSGGRVCGEAVQELAALAKCATGPGPTKIWKRYFLRLRRRGPGFGPATGQEAYRTWLRLVDKEWRELAASRAWWILLLGMGPLVGASFIGAACVGHVDRHVRATVSRIVAAEGVLEAIYSIANVAPPAGNDEEIFRGHPLAVAPSGAGAIFYGVWPGLIVLGGILLRRRLG